MTVSDPAQHHKAIVMFEQGGYSNREIADACGVHKRSVARWRTKWKEGNPAPARVQAAAGANVEADSDGDFDPAKANDVAYWEHQLRRYASAKEKALANHPPHTKAAAEMGRLEVVARKNLEEARETEQLRLEREERGRIRDPVVLALRLVGQLGKLLSMLGPEHRAEVVRVRGELDRWIKQVGT